MTKKLIGTIFILFVMIFGMSCFFAGYYMYHGLSPQTGKSIHLVNAKIKRSIPLVAVDSLGHGVISNLIIEIGIGEGRALVNINNVFADYDAQRSARNAMAAAENYLMEDLAYTDVIFSIESSAELVAGPSAGSAMAAALIATLKNAEINNKVLLTGTINKNGQIGQVGGVLQKAVAAKEHGATLFLVPVGQSHDCELKEVCKIVKNLKTCEFECGENFVDVEEYAKIKIIEVANISDAMNYLLK